MLEKHDQYSVSGDLHTLTFAFRNWGFIDGVSFTPTCGSMLTLQLNIQGTTAKTTTIHLGVPSSNPSTNPVTFTRTS
jgi:hypothetical protein